MANAYKGYIGKYYSVWCGKCPRWDHINADRLPDKEVRKTGWKLTKEFGWVCPDCVAK